MIRKLLHAITKNETEKSKSHAISKSKMSHTFSFCVVNNCFMFLFCKHKSTFNLFIKYRFALFIIGTGIF